jgi:hypothetical protein
VKPKKRQKLCLNCEGEVDLDVIVCPFCAADLREDKLEQKSTPQRFSDSLYPSTQIEKEVVQEEVQTGEPTIGGMVLLCIGAQLFLFALLLPLCSHDGIVTLKWTSRYWFLYLMASLPFLLFGYRSLK